MEVAIVIPAKGASDKVRNKNLFEIGGKSLVQLACEKVLRCNTVNQFFLDTEDEGIMMSCQDLVKRGLQIIRRPAELASDFIGANDLMIFELHSIPHCDLLIHTFATAALLTSETIDRCVTSFAEKAKTHDSFVSVAKVNEYFWQGGKPMNFDPRILPRRSEIEGLYMETQGLYGILTDTLLEQKTRVGSTPMLLEIPKLESLDVSGQEDLVIAERILSWRSGAK